MRLRSGALPTFLVTVSPRPGVSAATAMACTDSAGRPARLPRAALRNCARLVRRRNPACCTRAVVTASPLGRQALAAESAAQVENLAAGLGRHAGAEAMAPGADEFARLVSTLHSSIPRRARSSWLSFTLDRRPAAKGQQMPIRRGGRLVAGYKETGRASQRGERPVPPPLAFCRYCSRTGASSGSGGSKGPDWQAF